MKRVDSVIKEYVSTLSFDDLYFLSVRFNDRIASDLAEAAEFLSRSSEIDKWLLSAKNAEEFYDMLDKVQMCVDKELSRRTPEVVSA